MATARGLTENQARARLAEVGANDPAPARVSSLAAEVRGIFASPLVLLLLLATAVSALVGDIVDAAIIVVIVLASAALNFAQTYRSRVATDRLRQVVAPTASVLRDGVWREIPRVDVVPGDIVRLSAGDMVPADARLLEARDLHAQQAMLTGESLPVEKEARSGDDDAGRVFFGTSIVSGTATAEVIATGRATVFGDIATRLAARPPESELERGLKHFGALILRTVFFLVMFIVIVRIAMREDPLSSVLFAVALAVGLTPELLPAITAVTLSRGAVAMAREKVVVKHLASIQNLGSIDVLCCDKTGTLTAGDMVLARSVDALGAEDTHVLDVARVNSALETGIRSPLDAAILARAGSLAPVQVARAHSSPSSSLALGWTKLDEVPFDFERRRLSIVAEREGEVVLVTKGAPEAILPLATRCISAGEEHAFSDETRAACERVFETISADGLRVLAVASRRLTRRSAYGVGDEADLTLVGFLAFSDPPLPDAAEALRALARDGIGVKVLTGDSEIVARHVCAEVGLDVHGMLLGRDVERMTDSALAHVAERVTVFARMSPAQKNRVIVALRQRSHVVGFLGDGVNDAPSLHAADVGISVASGAEIARDAADIILLERHLSVLHRGILEGRKSFGNVMKYILMGTSSNFGNMLSMAGAAAILPFLPMLPTQILLNNLLYDFAQITIPTDRVDPAYVRRPQRWDVRTIRNFMLAIGPISSLFDFATFYVLLRVFEAPAAEFHTGWFVESLATQTLVVFVIRRLPHAKGVLLPSAPLVATVLGVVALGVVLPYTPIAAALGLTPLPLAYFAFLGATVAVYLAAVALAKRYVLLAPRTRKRRARA